MKFPMHFFVVLFVAAMALEARAVEYGMAKWPAVMGNHRAVVSVSERAPAVWAHLPWRRRDEKPADKNVLVVDLKTGQYLKNVAKVNLTQDFGDIVFEPATAPGEYAIYYYPLEPLPRRPMGTTNFKYAEPMDTASEEWLMENGLNEGRFFEANAFAGIPKAQLLRFEARSEMDRFDPMELPATEEELNRFLRFNQGQDFLLFPEDRARPIRMRKQLPVSWVERKSNESFLGQARRGEAYPFQVGVYALAGALKGLDAACSDLRSNFGAVIPASAIRCITLNGVDAAGNAMVREVPVPKGEVRGLWFVARVPTDVPAGQYEGRLTITPTGGQPKSLQIKLDVEDEILADGGVGELWRLSRLDWLDSRAGQQDEVTHPYEPMTVDQRVVRSLGKDVSLAANGLPESIRVGEREVLASPMQLVAITSAGQPLDWSGSKIEFLRGDASVVAWKGTSTAGGIAAIVEGRMEYDGYVFFTITLQAKQPVDLTDVKVLVPYRAEAAEYFMGFGQGRGGKRPANQIKWTWTDKPTNKVWMGSVEAGLQVKLRGPADQENTWSNYRPEETGIPESWHNGGKGGGIITPANNDVTLAVFTGPIQVNASASRELCFSLIPTPVKPRDPEHWTDPRRWDMRSSMLASISAPQAKVLGANDVTAFHATPANPWINYPFIADGRLRQFVADAHAAGVRARLYYTVRELSNHAAEFWPLWSMREEFFATGPGGGGPWLREHLLEGYSPAWSTTPEGAEGVPDDSLHTSGWNRFLNYYVESVAWLVNEREIDGLYFDGVTFGRRTIQRLRRVGDASRPDFRMDFHSGNTITRTSNAFNDCLELLPYLDSTWIGEGFNYDSGPDFYMVELSGIPFGLPNDMLQYGGNPWRGMVYGMVPRYIENHSASPSAMWRFWDGIGIRASRMIGYWDEKCPVRTNREDVLATVYRMPGKTLIAIGSWASEDVNSNLTIDFKALGLNASKVRAYLPEITEFQEGRSLDLSSTVAIPKGRGCLIVLSEEPAPQTEQKDSSPVAQAVSLDQASLGKGWTTKKPADGDGKIEVADGALAVSGSLNTYAYVERDIPAGVTGVQCQIRVPHLKVNRNWHDRHDGLNSPGVAIAFANGKSVRVSFASLGVVTIEEGMLDHMYKPVLQLRDRPADAWSWVRITWTDEAIIVACSADGKRWEAVREIPRGLFTGEVKSIRLGKLPKEYGWPRTLKFENTGGLHTGAFRDLAFLAKP